MTYLFLYMLRGLFVALVVLLGFMAVNDYLNFSLGESASDWRESVVIIALNMPLHAVQILPYAALLGCLSSLGGLSRNNELLALQATGLSKTRIALMAALPIFLVSLLGTVAMQYPAPQLQEMAETRKLAGGSSAVSSLWHREGNDFLHLQAIYPNGRKIEGFSRYTVAAEGGKVKVAFADTAEYDRSNKRWLLQGLKETDFSNINTDLVSRDITLWETSLTPRLLRLLTTPPQYLKLSERWYYARQLEQQKQWKLDSRPHLLAFWRACLDPLATLSLVLLGIGIIFRMLASSDIGTRISIGLLVVLVFNFTRDTLGAASLVLGFEPFWAVLLPPLLCLGAGLLLLLRSN